MPADKPTARTTTRSQIHTKDRGRLDHGMEFEGVIQDYNPLSELYAVKMSDGEIIEGVKYIVPIFGALISFKITARIPPGTAVKCTFGNPSYIVGCIANDVPDAESGLSRDITGTGIDGALQKAHPDKSEVIPGHSTPGNLYDGEVEMGNLTGSFVRFLTFMASLGSGERAQIQCHILRDLVRVISRNYEHFASIGDIKIFDDGRLNFEMNGTSYDHERWGAVNPNDTKAELEKDEMPEEVDPLETGRWRFSFLLGFIGDLFNGWFSDPCEAAGRMAEEAMRSGKARFHVGQDGAILIQSCADIAFERVVRIPVPIRLKHEEDPEGVLRAEMDQLDKEFLKMWDVGGEKTEHHQLYQIREYARHLSLYHSLARVHQLAAKNGEFHVPSEDDTPAPQVGAGEKDRKEANTGGLTYWKDAYATIRIMRDGSILTHDSYGGCVSQGPNGIEISSARHIRLYAAADIVMKAGGSAFISAKRDVEIAAHRGGLILKSRTLWRALCERGTMWLKSDYNPDVPYTPSGGDPSPEIVNGQALIMQATSGESRLISNRKFRALVERPGELMEFYSKGELKAYSKQDMTIKTTGSMSLLIQGSVNARWQSFTAQCSSFLLVGIARLSKGMSQFSRILASGVSSTGPVNSGSDLVQMKGNSQCCYRPHGNHMGNYRGPGPSLNGGPVTDQSFPDDDPKENFRMLKPEAYRWNGTSLGDKTDVDQLFEPLAQQFLRLETGNSGYETWANMTDDILSAPQTARDTPWPSKGMKWMVHNSSKPTLQEPSPGNPSSFSASIQTPLSQQSISFRILTK